MKTEYSPVNMLLIPLLGGLALLSLEARASGSQVPAKTNPPPTYAVAPVRREEEFPMLYEDGKPRGAKDFRGLRWLSYQEQQQFRTRRRVTS